MRAVSRDASAAVPIAEYRSSPAPCISVFRDRLTRDADGFPRRVAAERLPAGPCPRAVAAVSSPGARFVRRVVARPGGGELDVLGAVDVERGGDDGVVRVDDGLVAG